jgi:hypothetical protein
MAEAVIDGLEDSEDYRAFEAAVIADYDARTAVEREIVLRLASLLWRLRRIISIETDLLEIHLDIVRERRALLPGPPVESREICSIPLAPVALGPQLEEGADGEDDVCSSLPISVRDLTCRFLRLSNVDNGAFERLGRYNAALWKQTAQTLFLLHALRKP